MSTFSRMTENPATKRWENALWIDDYFERHHYGVQFPSDPETVWDPHKMRMRVADITEEEAAVLNDMVRAGA